MGAGERTGLRVNSDKTKIMKVMSTQVGGVRIGQDLLTRGGRKFPVSG